MRVEGSTGRVTAWMATAIPCSATVHLRADRRRPSNLTYRVTDAAGRFRPARPPVSHVLPTAHDMKRDTR